MEKEIKIADAVLEILGGIENGDLAAWLGWTFQIPLDDTAIAIKMAIGRAALEAMT